MMWKATLFFVFFHGCDDSFEPVHSIGSEPVGNRQGKQTIQESASTSEQPRSNQTPVKTLITM